jgi:hypothetical protein
MLDLIYFFLISLTILLSTLGYGFFFIKVVNFEIDQSNLGLVGFLGLFFLSLIASYSHFLFAHGFTHNLIILFIGLFSFYICVKKLNIKLNQSVKYLILIFLLLFIALIFSKSNEDFPYYHLPNTLHFAEQKLQFGLGNLNHGFKHISSIFMLMSLNYLPYFEYYLFNLTNFVFFVFLIYFAIHEIYLNSSKNHNVSRLLISFILILFLTKFSRLAEYGSDIAAQIIISVYLYFLFEILFNDSLGKSLTQLYLKFSIIFIIFATTLKFILVIYSIFLIMVLFKMKKNFFFQILKLKYLVLIFTPIIFYIFFNFSSTGCLLYPVEKTCLNNYFEWALSSDLVEYMNIHYETWAKGGKGPNFSVNEPLEYIESFNWISHWIDVYFKNKVLDFILVSFTIIIVFNSFFFKETFSKKKIINKNNIEFRTLYSLIILVFLIWFFNFPTLRYAGYIIFYLLIIFPFIIFFDRFIDTKNISSLKKISYIFIFCYAVFLYKNSTRLYSELNIPIDQNHSFANFPYYWIDDVKFEEKFINGIKVYSTGGMCWNIPTICVRGIDTNIKKKNNYIFYYKK